MPVYEITGPDGKVYEIEGPSGATKEQVVDALQYYKQNPPTLEELVEALRKADAAGDVEAAKELTKYIQDRMSNTDSVTTQKTEQPTKPIDVSAAYIDAAEMALVIGVLWYVIFKILMPKKWKATNSSEMGRVWLAWSVGLSLVSAANWYRKSGFSEASAIFVVTVIFLGPLSFLFGWLYGKYFKFTDTISTNSKSATQPNVSVIPADSNLYLLAMEEYDSDKRDKALWAKCFALSDGDETKTKSTYIKERADTFYQARVS